MKSNKALGILLILIGVAALIYVLGNDGKIPFGKWFSNFTAQVGEQQSFPSDELSNIDIESDSLDVNIVRGSGDDVVVTLAGRATKGIADNFTLDAEQNGDTLKLTLQSDDSFRLGFHWSDVEMTVELPDKAWNEINARLSSGDLSLEGIQAESAALRSGSGDVKAVSLNASGEAVLEAGSGDIEIEDITAEAIRAKSNSGDIEIERYEARLLDFDAASGDVALEDGFAELKGEAGSGNIHVNADELRYDSVLKNGSGDISIDLAKEPEALTVSIRSGSGDAEVLKDGFVPQGNNDDNDANGMFGTGSVKLQASSGSGDIVLR
ncbi:DUF4097 family beta strand repeat-containing protein [Paenibacillus thailandensis]|uniref:DUF4097 family beta strand repeat-containing protein n=1 Tax=Paenibacillus thailandensis TaxID=393250 RepID=A0ABW5QYK5_9BACL